MKLATLRNGTRDGQLVVVSSDLTRMTPAGAVAPTLQHALDYWPTKEQPLRDLSQRLEIGQVRGEPFDETLCAAPLPRAYQWIDGSAYLNHVELVRKARGADMPESYRVDPLMYQGGSDAFLGPREPIIVGDEAFGIDLEGEVAVITGDVPMGATREIAAEAIRLVLLVNDVSLRHLIPAEIAKGFGFLQSKPPTAFSPVAVTPDALGDAWDGGKLSGPLSVNINGSTFGRADAGVDMSFDFPDLIVHATRTRPLTAGTIVGSGTVSNRNEGDAPNPVAKGGVGYSCIAEVRMTEILTHGEAKTPFLTFGDRVRIDMLDRDGRSIFGAIDQTVKSVAEVA